MIACVIKIIALSLHPLKGKRPLAQGEVAEWSIAAVLKTVVLRGTGGSNPSLSARKRGSYYNCLVFLFRGVLRLFPFGYSDFCISTTVTQTASIPY